MTPDAEPVEAPTEPSWRETALALYAQGLGIVEIGRRLKRHSNTISKFLREEGVRKPKVPDISWHDAALALAAEDIGPSEVARRLGLTKNTVSGFFDRKGIKFRNSEESNIWTRTQALHDKMDQVLAQTRKRESHIVIIHKQVAAFTESRQIL